MLKGEVTPAGACQRGLGDPVEVALADLARVVLLGRELLLLAVEMLVLMGVGILCEEKLLVLLLLELEEALLGVLLLDEMVVVMSVVDVLSLIVKGMIVIIMPLVAVLPEHVVEVGVVEVVVVVEVGGGGVLLVKTGIIKNEPKEVQGDDFGAAAVEQDDFRALSQAVLRHGDQQTNADEKA